MKTILIDMKSDGSFHVEVSDEQLELLMRLNREYGTVARAIARLDESHPDCKEALNIFRNAPQVCIPTFVFYTSD